MNFPVQNSCVKRFSFHGNISVEISIPMIGKFGYWRETETHLLLFILTF